jgi:hypothetical protein
MPSGMSTAVLRAFCAAMALPDPLDALRERLRKAEHQQLRIELGKLLMHPASPETTPRIESLSLVLSEADGHPIQPDPMRERGHAVAIIKLTIEHFAKFSREFASANPTVEARAFALDVALTMPVVDDALVACAVANGAELTALVTEAAKMLRASHGLDQARALVAELSGLPCPSATKEPA